MTSQKKKPATLTVFVTGATGTIGREVVNALKNAPGVTVKVGVRKESFAKLPQGKNIVPVHFDWSDASTFTAMAGADRAFIATPVVPDSDALVTAFVTAAQKHGLKHLVKLSSAGTDADKPIKLAANHKKGERALEESGLAYTILRPGMFADNFIGYWPPQKDGNIYLPFGTATLALIDARDVGRVAAAALSEDGHENKIYPLTGPASLSVADVAAELTKATGRTIRYVAVDEKAAAEGMRGAGMPEWIVADFSELYAIAKNGELAEVVDTVQRVTGKAPIPFATFARDHKAAWT